MQIWAILGPDGQDGAKGCGRALGARPPHPRTGPNTTPNPYPKGQKPDKTDVRLGSRGGVGLRAANLILETLYYVRAANLILETFYYVRAANLILKTFYYVR